MGYFVAMETYVTLLLLMHVICNVHSLGPINVCTNLENLQKSYVLVDVT